MPRWQQIYVIVCASVIGYAASYSLAVFSDWPLLTYFPYEREWRMVTGGTGPVPASYLGIVAWGAGGALIAAGVAAVATRLVPRVVPDRWLLLFGGWALTAFVLAGAFFTWSLLIA